MKYVQAFPFATDHACLNTFKLHSTFISTPAVCVIPASAFAFALASAPAPASAFVPAQDPASTHVPAPVPAPVLAPNPAPDFTFTPPPHLQVCEVGPISWKPTSQLQTMLIVLIHLLT